MLSSCPGRFVRCRDRACRPHGHRPSPRRCPIRRPSRRAALGSRTKSLSALGGFTQRRALRRFERIGEVRRYSRLNVGRHQVERKKKSASPKWGWSGVQKIVPPLWAEAELRGVAGLLPSRQSSIENIVAELFVIGSRYHRNLHQDEFGPTRAERMQALRDLLDRLEVLSSRLEALPPQLRLLVSERQTCRGAATRSGASA